MELMPIPCVDVVVLDELGQILLLKRKREPARGQWWFPGGRVLRNETRAAAVIRKLNTECGLGIGSALPLREVLTSDLFLSSGADRMLHAITTVFQVGIRGTAHELQLDEQSEEASWRERRAWLSEELHPFIRGVLSMDVMDARLSRPSPLQH